MSQVSEGTTPGSWQPKGPFQSIASGPRPHGAAGGRPCRARAGAATHLIVIIVVLQAEQGAHTGVPAHHQLCNHALNTEGERSPAVPRQRLGAGYLGLCQDPAPSLALAEADFSG